MKEYKFEEKFYWNVLCNYVNKYLEEYMYSQTSVHERLGSWTIRFMVKFSEHKASRMTYCVSSYKHASRQHREAISWEYQCQQYL